MALVLFVFSIAVWAEEPGYLRNESLPPAPPSAAPRAAPASELSGRGKSLADEFTQARGLRESEVSTLDVMRISCDGRLFTSDGIQIKGDGDLKVTGLGRDHIQAEFPSHLSFEATGFNPFENGVSDLDTVSRLQLVNIRGWRDGQPLKLTKRVRVRFDDRRLESQLISVEDELRVLERTYPLTYLVRETVHTSPEFSLYLICQ